MSTFQVRQVSTNLGSGYVTDTALVNGASIQKTIFVTGPNLTFRQLDDGTQFDSTNYWKRFAPISEGGDLPDNQAFITIISDDGTPYSDTNPDANKFARVVDLTVSAGTTFSLAANQIDILADFGGVSMFTQIVTDEIITVRLNSSSSADLDVPVGTLVFDNGDLPLTSLAFDNSASGATDATVQVLLTIQIQSDD